MASAKIPIPTSRGEAGGAVAADSGQRPDNGPLELLLPESWDRPLWKSLLVNFSDLVAPEKLPPLRLTSRPVDVGLLIGDVVSMPWYRTIFRNLGDVISPEILPPLELESRPMDVGELVGDQLSHLWWTSLLRNLADRIAPESVAPLALTSTPVDASLRSGSIQIVRWSSMISVSRAPGRQEPATPTPSLSSASTPELFPTPQFGTLAGFPLAKVSDVPSRHAHGIKLRLALSRSRVREIVFVSIAAVEVFYLVASAVRLI